VVVDDAEHRVAAGVLGVVGQPLEEGEEPGGGQRAGQDREPQGALCADRGDLFRPNRAPVAATCGVRPTGPVKSSVSEGGRPVMGAGQRGMRSGNWRAKALSAAVQPWVPGFLGSTRLECAPFL
jgi:hypothetical protein